MSEQDKRPFDVTVTVRLDATSQAEALRVVESRLVLGIAVDPHGLYLTDSKINRTPITRR